MATPGAPLDAPLYRIGLTRAGFLGAFARQPIPKGAVVLCEQPLFVVDAPLQAYLFHRAAGGSGPTPVEGDEEDEEAEAATLEEFLDRGIRRTLSMKTEEQREQFWDLANTHDELPKAFGIFTTNAVSTTEEAGGLFLTLSRFNSGCRPNLTRPLYDEKARTFSLSALHDIPEGEELCWPYLGVPFEFDSIESRRAELHRVFGFECSCDACTSWLQSDEMKRESEARLLRLRRLKEGLSSQRGGRESVLEQMATLAEAEGLWEVADRLKEQARVEGEISRASSVV